jgi:hypothetical protein
MQLRQVGNDLEAMCEGCGEILLICDGDSLNFRLGPDGIPSGFLCSVCNKNENGDTQNVAKIGRLKCMCCERDLDPENESFEPHHDEEGMMDGAVCQECSWQNPN